MDKTPASRKNSRISFLPTAQGTLQRVCACGNHAMAGGECTACARKKTMLQRKLTMGADNDPLEREADRIAGQVMARSAAAVSTDSFRIQRASQQAGSMAIVPASVDRVLAGPGKPFDAALQQDMEQRFGHDFSKVRVHTGAAAAQSAQEVNAYAYTVGRDIVFGAGQFVPGTSDGRRLIAHELTHVLQQSGVSGIGGGKLGTVHDPLLQRDLALQPTNPNAREVNLTAQQIRDAINFNRRRYDAENTRLIQDVVGAPVTGTFDEETIRLIARYQDDFGFTPADGKVGPDTFDQLTAELQAEGVDDQTCLTLFNVSDPAIPLNIRVAGPGLADIFSRFSMTARFSPHCHCDQFEYRQFICGSVDRTQGGVATNINHLFAIPGGGLPQCPGWVEDGNTAQAQNGRYGHRNHAARVNNRYLDDTGTVDMANGCRFEAFDVPGMFGVPGNSGDRYDFDIRFFGDIRRNGRRVQRKFWAVRDNLTIP
ncbi:MAG: DUF4157 domain-containing protein [Nitrosomonas sp.]|nr:DUF4157 domain-containing protein [Nitrosomonas sp.]